MSTVLKQLSLVAYRGIADLVLRDLTPLSLIVGANNAGKTSILEAASLLLRPPDPAQWVSVVRQRDGDGPFIDGLWSLFPGSVAPPLDLGEALVSMELHLGGVTSAGDRDFRATCTLRQQVGAVVWNWPSGAIVPGSMGTPSPLGPTGPTGLWSGERRGDGGRWGDIEFLADLDVRVGVDPPVVLKFPNPVMFQHQVPLFRVFTINPAAHYSTGAVVEHLSRVIEDGSKDLAIRVLQVFDPEVADLDVVASANEHGVRVTHTSRGVVPLSSFGDGMRQAATIALALTRASQGVLLIDELEAGIHPSVLAHVVARLRDAAAIAQCQIIATTHSLEAVDAVVGCIEAAGAAETLCAFYLRRRDGQHEVRRYDFAQLLELREGGLDIR